MLIPSIALPLLLPIAGALGSSGHEPQHKSQATKRVAIIGAGAGGSSAAYHLAQYAQNASIDIAITVFERNSYIGGRTTTVNAWDDPKVPIELGGSIFVEVNQILVEAMNRFNLSSSSRASSDVKGVPELGIWNSEEFIVVTSQEDGWWDKAKLIWRYGYAPFKTNSLMKATVGKFLKMYEEPVFPWKSLSDVAEELELTPVTAVTGEQFLKANGVGELFTKEIIQASTRVNYASNLPFIHGLETMVCMATNGAMAVENGNWQIFANMLNSSSAITTHLNTAITTISKQSDETYKIITSNKDTSKLDTLTFDEVILAAPLQFSNLVIDPTPNHVPDEIPYTKLHVTLFATPYQLSPKMFNLEEGQQVPQFVLTTLHPNESPEDNVGNPGFYSISIVGRGNNPSATGGPRPELIYKIFSQERVNADFLSRILGQEITEHEAEKGSPDGSVSWILHKLWHSYPREYPRVTFDEIKLDDGLWYTSSIESFISTMETSALSGKNVARLVVDEWQQKGVAGQKETQEVQDENTVESEPLEEDPAEL